MAKDEGNDNDKPSRLSDNNIKNNVKTKKKSKKINEVHYLFNNNTTTL